ncbi:O-antigen ligase family protein [Pseudomonadota bacterium]
MIILFLVLTAIYFIAALRWTSGAVLILPLFFPLYLFKVSLYGIPVTLIEMFIYSAFLAFCLRAFYVHYKKHGISKIIAKVHLHFLKHRLFSKDVLIYVLPILLLILGAVLSFMATPESVTMLDGSEYQSRKVALGIFKGWIISPILMFLMLFFVIKKNKQVLTLFNYYTVSAFILSLWATFQIATQQYITPDARASGPFESANYLALYLAPAVLYTMIRVKESLFPVIYLEKYSLWKLPFRRGKFPIEKPETVFSLMGFLVFFLVLLFAKSYGAVIGIGVAAIFYFGLEYFQYHKRKLEKKVPWKTILGTILIIGITALSLYNVDPGKWESMFKFDERNSSSVRIEVYTVSLNLLQENWLLGIGMGNYPAMYQTEAERILGHEPYELNMLHPHNIFVAAWLNLGLIGLSGFIWIIVLCFHRAAPYMKDFAYNKVLDNQKLGMIGISMLLITLAHGMFDTPFFKNDLSLLFWVIVAMCLLPYKSKEIQVK